MARPARGDGVIASAVLRDHDAQHGREDSEGTCQDALIKADLTLSNDVSSGTLDDLISGTELICTAKTFDTYNMLIFSGTHKANLASADG